MLQKTKSLSVAGGCWLLLVLLFLACASGSVPRVQAAQALSVEREVLAARPATLSSVSAPLQNAGLPPFVGPTPTPTARQALELCYDRCIAYEFFWYDNFYQWDNFLALCSISPQNAALTWLDFANSLSQGGGTAGIEAIFKGFSCYWFLTSGLQELKSFCANVCQDHQDYYYPDLSIWGEYDLDREQLVLTLGNNGGSSVVPTEDRSITYEVYAAHTSDASRQTGIDDSSTNSPHLVYAGEEGAALSPPGNRWRGVEGVRPSHVKLYIPYTPVPDEYNEVVLHVDRAGHFQDRYAGNNTYRFFVGEPPAPADLHLSPLLDFPVPDDLSRHTIWAYVENRGELPATAHVTVYDRAGNVVSAAESYVSGGVQNLVTFVVPVAVEQGDGSVRSTQRFTLRVADDEGQVHDELEVSVQAIHGIIQGCVYGADGKGLGGASVAAGRYATTASRGGCYTLEVGDVGEMVVTASHPDYTDTASQVVTLSYQAGEKDVHKLEQGLLVEDVDLYLGSRVEPPKGTLIMAVYQCAPQGTIQSPLAGVTYEFVALPGGERISGTIDQETTFELPIGDYMFWASKPGYVPKMMYAPIRRPLPDLQPVPLEFYPCLSPTTFKRDDQGLYILSAPSPLWQMETEGNVIEVTSSKDGSLLAVYTGDPSNHFVGQLRFLEPLSGTLRGSAPIPAVGRGLPPRRAILATPHFGHVIGFYFLQGDRHVPGQTDASGYHVYVPDGRKQAEYKDPEMLGILRTQVYDVPSLQMSPDGIYLYLDGLYFLPSIHPIPAYEAQPPAAGGRYERQEYLKPFIFTVDDQLIGACPDGSPHTCKYTLREEIEYEFPDSEKPLVLEAAGNGLAIASRSSLAFYEDEIPKWTKSLAEVTGNEGPWCVRSMSMSPGGFAVMLSLGCGSGGGELRILNHNGMDITPAEARGYHTVRHVSANEQGWFYLAADGQYMTYYQVAGYGPRTGEGEPPKEEKTTVTPDATRPRATPGARPTTTPAAPGERPSRAPSLIGVLVTAVKAVFSFIKGLFTGQPSP